MPSADTQVLDATARVVLPPSFAEATVTIQQISENEVRIRKKTGDADEDVVFVEESITVLSDRDRDRFLHLLENPPPPNEALRRLFAEQRKQDG